jgi:PPOX class probable F420-dependent enzyme
MWELVAGSHTGILATLRSVGAPSAVPMWFVVSGRLVYLRTLAGTAKAANVRRDARVCFTVEAGRAWAELRAAVVHGRASLVSDRALRERIDALFDMKYAGYRTPEAVPDATRRHYARPRAYIAIEPSGRPLTWDNAKLRAGG